MKLLYLLRHAKSSWKDPDLADFHRPLNARGSREAREMAEYMYEKNYRPEKILCSTAVRTKKTLEPILEKLEFKGDVDYKDSLYLASARAIENEVKSIEFDSLLIVGHNYGIEDYLNILLDKNLTIKTCQLAVIDLDKMELMDFIRPKDM